MLDRKGERTYERTSLNKLVSIHSILTHPRPATGLSSAYLEREMAVTVISRRPFIESAQHVLVTFTHVRSVTLSLSHTHSLVYTNTITLPVTVVYICDNFTVAS